MTQLDASAIKEIKDLTLVGHLNSDLQRLDHKIAVLPDNCRIHRLENFNELRDRFRGCMSTTSIADFVRYSIKNSSYEDPGVSCFIDAEKMKAETIFNIGTIAEPGHADNKAQIGLTKTAPFRAVLDINGKKNRQKELAEWLEDWRDYLTAYDIDGEAMDIKKAVGAIRRISIESISTADHEDQDFSAKRSIMESVEAKSKDVMPVAFYFSCYPYEGLSERSFSLRLSIITNDTPLLVLRIVQLEAHEEAMAIEFRDLLAGLFEEHPVDTFIGDFSS